MEIRPMVVDDVAEAEQISDQAFYEVDLRTHPRGWPEPERRSPARSERWRRRTESFLASDPTGCLAAVDETGLLGFATSVARERLWVLVTFAVRPGLQGKGIGKRLLAAAMASAPQCTVGMLSASEDAGALRRYHLAGFALHPQMLLRGEPDRGAVPAVSGVREGDLDRDREWMDDVDRDLRGGPHAGDHDSLMAMSGRLLVAEDRSGYAYTSGSETFVVAAREESTARSLLWEALAGAEGSFTVSHVTTANPWALDVALRARLALATNGYLGVRGTTPPTTYVHNGALL